jgi:hypothetical protein
VPNSLSQLQHAYASGSASAVPATPENLKEFDEQDGQSDCSDLHTPAQPSKRQRLPSVSPYKNRQVTVSESDSDGVYRDFLFKFDSSSSSKCGFKRQLQPWSLVKEWSLVDYDREVAYEEIKTIMTQSLD